MGIFGPSHVEVLQRFAEKMEGNYIRQGLLKNDYVEYSYKSWPVFMDYVTHSTGQTTTTYTRIRIPFRNDQGFKFKIYQEGFFSGIGKVFGMQDIQIGQMDFDERFIIKSSSEETVKALLNDTIRESMLKIPKLHLTINRDDAFLNAKLDYNETMLEYQVVGMIKDLNLLIDISRLMEAVMDQMVTIDVTTEEMTSFRMRT